jgi:hypothetical protein
MTKDDWVAYRPLLATHTKFGKYVSNVDKTYCLIDIEGVATKCESKSVTKIYENNLIKQLNEHRTIKG